MKNEGGGKANLVIGCLFRLLAFYFVDILSSEGHAGVNLISVNYIKFLVICRIYLFYPLQLSGWLLSFFIRETG